MPRQRLVWLSVLPLVSAGSLAAHAVAYRIVEPDASQRATELAASGHGYLAYAPAALAACLALLLAALAAHAVRAFRGERSAHLSRYVALVPLVGFPLQEHLERLLASGHVPLTTALESSFLLGLALQLPFALAALFLARALVRVAERIGGTLASTAPACRRIRIDTAPAVATSVPRVRALAFGCSQRGPPA